MTRRALIIALLAALGACGRKGPVRRPRPEDDQEKDS
jgi:predicted small lipoprotein YifL